MHWRMIIGQVTVIAGILVLAASIPWMPWRYGLPPHRSLEMLAVWVGLTLMLAGFEIGRGAISLLPEAASRGQRSGAYVAALGIVLAVAACGIALLNMTVTTMWGGRILRLGTSMYLYSRTAGYLLGLPLLAALAAQLPALLARPRDPGGYAQSAPMKTGRLMLWIVCGLLGCLFLTQLALSAASRWAGVGAVVLTALAGVPFFLMSVANVVWAASISRKE